MSNNQLLEAVYYSFQVPIELLNQFISFLFEFFSM